MSLHHRHTKPFASRRRSNPPHINSSRGTAETSGRDDDREIPILQLPPPNIIARLMGVDAIPIVVTQPHGHHPTLLKPPAAAAEAPPFRQAKTKSSSRDLNGGDSRHYHCLMKKMRVPGRSRSRQRRRRHPQEDLLQKIRHDFQATWQQQQQQASSDIATGSDCSVTSAARRRSTPSSSAQLSLSDGRRSIIQIVAQENLRKQKMARYGLATTTAAAMEDGNPLPLNNNATIRCSSMQQAGGDEPNKPQDPCAGAAASGKYRDLGEELLQPTPIVLLKPGTSSHVLIHGREGQGPLFGLPRVKRDATMTRFLQEVKGTLHQQLKANATTSDPTKPEQIVGDIVAKQTKDKRFFRSESFRGFRSDRDRRKEEQASSSPEHVRIVTRNHLLVAHRITSRRAAPRATTETVPSPEKDDEEESVGSSCSISCRERVRSLADVVSPSASSIGFGEQSFRSECQMKHKDDSSAASSSARALLRSFSAPELGFSLFSPGRLFGDGSVRSTTCGVASEGSAAMTSYKNSAAFGFIRGTVSSFRRHSFSLRRNLFMRKMHSSKKTSPVEIHPQMAIGTAPPSPETVNLFKVAQANLTELPPSPVSPLEVAGHSCRHLFSDFNCTLPEMSPRYLSEFETPASELSYKTDFTVETACYRDKAYIREVLVAAGLYDDGSGSLDNKANARVDSMARPICDDIFEEVEDIYYYRGKYCDDAIGSDDAGGGSATDHRMLFDLANEALQSLVQQGAKTTCSSSPRQWILDSTGVSRGKRLVDDVWQQVQTLRNPQMQEMQTIDSMVAYEIRKSAWAEVLYEDVYVVGRKIERAIFDELIEDLMVEGFHLINRPEQIDAFVDK